MKQTINFYGFQKAFQDLRPNSFTYEGLRALFEYLEDPPWQRSPCCGGHAHRAFPACLRRLPRGRNWWT